ncbi:hypothetical protein ACNKHX_03760 [Shigella flexneri]
MLTVRADAGDFSIPMALCFAFGEVTAIAARRTSLWAMSVIFVICVGVATW